MSLWQRIQLKLFPDPENAFLRTLKARRFESSKIPLHCPDGLIIEGLKPNEAYNEYKDVWVKKIYDFQTDNPTPFIIDGGAYVGASVLWFKRRYPNSKINAYECDPESLSVFEQNLKLNQIEDVNIIRAACSDKDGSCVFSGGGDDSGSIMKGNSGGIEVQTRRLSQDIDREVDFLKLNIEGAEYDVIRELKESGALSQIKEMAIEIHSFPNQEQRLDEILHILRHHGFKYLIYHFDADSNLAVMPPFKLDQQTEYILLLYAKRMD